MAIMLGAVLGAIAGAAAMRAWDALRPRLVVRGLEAVHVVVQTDNHVSTQGILERAGRDAVVLSHARQLGTDGDVLLSGEVVIPRDRIWRYDRPAASDLAGADR